MMVLGLSANIVDVETIFLYGNLEEEINMGCPPGMDSKEGEVLILDKYIYGLVQRARQYHRKAVQILKKIRFEGGQMDPCLYMKESTELGPIYIAFYVDNN